MSVKQQWLQHTTYVQPAFDQMQMCLFYHLSIALRVYIMYTQVLALSSRL